MNSTQSNVSGRKVAPGSAPTPTSVDPEELLDCEEAAKLLRLNTQTLASWRCKDRGPPYLKSGRAVFYRRSDISTWLAGQIVRPSAA